VFELKKLTNELTLVRLQTRLSGLLSYGTFVPLLGGVLIDSGFFRARRSLAKALQTKPPQLIVHTHAHEDHIGNSAFLKAAFGTAVFAPKASLPILKNPSIMAHGVYRRLIWGVPDGLEANPLPDTLEAGQVRLMAIPTPGHAHDHVVFFEPERRWVFLGDLFLSAKVPCARPYENALDLMDSLRRVIDLRPKFAFCYHKGALSDPENALKAKLSFMEGLREKILPLHEKGMDAATIACKVLGQDPRLMHAISRGDFSGMHLVRSFLRPPGEGYELPNIALF
jgi:glyoxylase-like metal-dependent hydrolase (beta-lactamase superfamily II)